MSGDELVRRRVYTDYVKRFIDFWLALVLGILTSPIILFAYILIRLDSEGDGFFKQERIGKDSKKFVIYKLRTMKLESKDENEQKIRDRDRLTKVGRIIRSLSLDELPQLLNILKGEMSFIGPRPLLVRYLPYYTEEENRRHDVLPGVAGLAQVNGRSFLQWEERFQYDVEYVDNVSFIMDLKILVQTIYKVIKREGTSAIRPEKLVDFDVHRNFKKMR